MQLRNKTYVPENSMMMFPQIEISNYYEYLPDYIWKNLLINSQYFL